MNKGNNKMEKRKHLIIEEEVDLSKAMENNNANMEKPSTIEKHADLPPVYADAVEQHEKIKKSIGKELKDMNKIVKDKGIVPENPGTGKKISRKPYTERYQLDESLFEDWDKSDDGFVSEKRCREILNDWIDWEEEDADEALEQLRSLLSEDEITEEEYDYIVQNWDDLLDESLTEKRNTCRGEECANDKEARANRFAQKAAHKEKNDKRDELEEAIDEGIYSIEFDLDGEHYCCERAGKSCNDTIARLKQAHPNFENIICNGKIKEIEESVEKCPDCGKEICECDKKEITESQQPEIFECPECHRHFSLGEAEHNELECECPKCHSRLIKTDNGEYTTVYESKEIGANNKLEEEFNLSISLGEFEPWTERAEKTWSRILSTDGAFDRLEAELEMEYPEGMSEDAFNDLLRFESEWVLQIAGVIERPEEDEEDE